MNREASFLNGIEHRFALGCHITQMQYEILLPEENIQRALYVFPFHPPFIIEICTMYDMAELTFHRENLASKDTETFNTQWRWFRQVLADIEAGHTPSNVLPESYQYISDRSMLSPAQLQWIQTQLGTIPVSLLTSDDPIEGVIRDGAYLRGQYRIFDNPTYTFDIWAEHSKNEAVFKYFLYLYQLACSVLTDASSRLALINMQRYFFGVNTIHLTEFVFPLIH